MLPILEEYFRERENPLRTQKVHFRPWIVELVAAARDPISSSEMQDS